VVCRTRASPCLRPHAAVGEAPIGRPMVAPTTVRPAAMMPPRMRLKEEAKSMRLKEEAKKLLAAAVQALPTQPSGTPLRCVLYPCSHTTAPTLHQLTTGGATPSHWEREDAQGGRLTATRCQLAGQLVRDRVCNRGRVQLLGYTAPIHSHVSARPRAIPDGSACTLWRRS
jgi:hypothetical protein